jgi:hypothetical protein
MRREVRQTSKTGILRGYSLDVV